MPPATCDYLALQLQFAAHFARLTGSNMAAAVPRCTNFRRRFGPEGDAGEPLWQAYVDGLADPGAASTNLAWTQEFQGRCAGQPLPALRFGCFSFDPPDEAGVLRVHYRNPDPAPTASPLGRGQIGRRQAELAAMFAHIRQHYPSATTVRGGSWLYNLDAYKRLFPSDYVRSAALPDFPLHLNGTSTWGQVLDWRGEVKPAVREQLLGTLHRMDPDAPWRVFPLQCLVPVAPIACFYAQRSDGER